MRPSPPARGPAAADMTATGRLSPARILAGARLWLATAAWPCLASAESSQRSAIAGPPEAGSRLSSSSAPLGGMRLWPASPRLSGDQLTRAVICAQVSGRSAPEIGKNSNRVGPIRGRSRPMMSRCGSLAANLSRLAWSSQTENVQNVFRGQAGVQRVADQPGGLGELAADLHGVAQEAGNEAVGLQRQPRRHRDVLALRVDRLALQPGQGGHRESPSVT